MPQHKDYAFYLLGPSENEELYSTIIYKKSNSCIDVPFIRYFNGPGCLPELEVIDVFKM